MVHKAPLGIALGSFILQAAQTYGTETDTDLLAQEKRALLEEAKRIRAEQIKKKTSWLVVWMTIFGVLMFGVVYLASMRDIQAAIREVIDQERDSTVDRWKASMGIDKCHNLARKHILVHSDVNYENLSTFSSFKSPAVFFVKDDADLTLEEACGLESFAMLLADLMVYAVQLKCKASSHGMPTNKYKSALSETYKNLMAVNVEGGAFFRHTSLSGRWRCGSNLAIQQAMLLLVWRFGGLAVHPGVALTRRSFINFPSDQIHLSQHYVVSYAKCAPPVYYLLTYLASRPREETALDITKVAKDIFDALCCTGICPNVITEDRTRVCDGMACPLLKVKNVSQISQLCPKTWRVLEETLRISGKTKVIKQPE